jgi:hypothetical protein
MKTQAMPTVTASCNSTSAKTLRTKPSRTAAFAKPAAWSAAASASAS